MPVGPLCQEHRPLSSEISALIRELILDIVISDVKINQFRDLLHYLRMSIKVITIQCNATTYKVPESIRGLETKASQVSEVLLQYQKRWRCIVSPLNSLNGMRKKTCGRTTLADKYPLLILLLLNLSM